MGQVFNSRYGRLSPTCTFYMTTKLSNLELKTWPTQVLGFLPLTFALPRSFLKTELACHECLDHLHWRHLLA